MPGSELLESRFLRASLRASCGAPGPAAEDALVMTILASVGFASNQCDLLVADLLDEALDLGVAELGLGLALELRVAELHRDDRGETLADVLTRELLVLLLEDLLVLGVAVDDRRQRRAEALLGAALVRVDRVGERVDRLGVGVGPLHRDVEAHRHVVLAGALGGEADDRLVDRALLGVDVRDVVLEAAVVPVGDLGGLERLVLVPARGAASASETSSASPVSTLLCPARSSRRTIVRPLLRKAISCRRRLIVSNE